MGDGAAMEKDRTRWHEERDAEYARLWRLANKGYRDNMILSGHTYKTILNKGLLQENDTMKELETRFEIIKDELDEDFYIDRAKAQAKFRKEEEEAKKWY